MRNKMNAFTLIELLAVIVILAIIALIATPIILGIVEDAKKDAFLRSVELVISTTDIDIANKTFEEEYMYTIENGNISDLEVSVKNTKGMNGEIIYDVDGKEIFAIYNGTYCVKKTKDMEKAEITDYSEGECTVIIKYTSENCFAFSNGTITDYYDYENNDSNNPSCPRDVVIPDKINEEVVSIIGRGAFSYSGITSVKFPNNLEIIESSAFVGSCYYDFYNWNMACSEGITSIELPSSITSIGSEAFSGNAIVGELDLSNLVNLTNISGFSYTKITSVILPPNLEIIGSDAFSYSKLSGELDLSYLTSLTSIGYGAFMGAYNGSTNQITSVKLPRSVTKIDRAAFGNNILSSVTFYGRSDLTGITIGDFVWDWAEGYDETNGFHFVNE